MTQYTINIVPQTFSATVDNIISQIIVRGYTKFDPFEGVTAIVSLINEAGEVISNVQAKISGDAWQNWPSNNTPEADQEYAQTAILAYLKLTAQPATP